MYEELIVRLRKGAEVKRLLEQPNTEAILKESADAIEELTKKQEVLLNNVETMSNLLSRLGTELDDIKATVSHLQDSQHYSGRYIKSIMGVKGDEQTTDEGD